MIALEETIEVSRPVEHCFRYISDFRTTLEWDPTVLEADKTTDGRIDVGTRFALRCKAGPVTVSLEYVIEELTPFHCIVLSGKGRFFDVRDIITLEDMGRGVTRITYIAQFSYRFGLEHLARQQTAGLKKMGRASVQGLARALADDNPTPTASRDTAKRDEHLPGALSCFTRLGYRRGRSRWAPMSTDMTGKHVVLTGANSGLGAAAAVSLLEAGATLTVVIRNPANTDAMQAHFTRTAGRPADFVELADLSLLSDVNELSDRLLAEDRPIDVLINNAGALFNDFAVTSEGIEQSVALLLLSPWRMTERLLPLLEHHDSPARVINVVSGGMYTQRLDCDHLIMPEGTYNGAIAYARAKRALTVLTELWAEEWQTKRVVVNSMHPGWADTPGVQSALPGFRRITQTVLRSSEEGADTIVWLARAREAADISGKLFLDREPRTTHLRKSTKEPPAARANLLPWLRATYAALSIEGNS